MKMVRKSIYANKEISKGEKFSEENIITLRPQRGMPANQSFFPDLITSLSKPWVSLHTKPISWMFNHSKLSKSSSVIIRALT